MGVQRRARHMGAVAPQRRGDRNHVRAWSGLELLLQTYPEGIPGVAAVDRLVAGGIHEREAMGLLEQWRATERIALSRGRWYLR